MMIRMDDNNIELGLQNNGLLYDDEDLSYESQNEDFSYEEDSVGEEEDDNDDNDDDNNDVGPQNGDFLYEKYSISKHSLKTVDYRAMSPDELLRNLHQEVTKISSVLNIDENDCYILLHYFNWNSEKLMDQLMDNLEDTREKAGLPIEETKSNNKIDDTKKILCDICCEEKQETFALICDHRYCSDCYIYYLKEKVFSGIKLIKCPSFGCPLVFTLKNIKMMSDYMVAKGITADVKEVEDAKKAAAEALLKNLNDDMDDWTDSEDEVIEVKVHPNKPLEVEKTLYERYEEVSIKSYVESHSNYKWCPSPDCRGIVSLQNYSKNYLRELSIEHKNNLIPIVSCPFGHSFCFMCNYENHIPVPCWITQLWIRKCKDDSETANWINANTKSCPKCESTIEKNGGCNHMTCKKCKFEFCWMCMGVWSKHGNSYYNCSMYEDTDSKLVRSQQELSKTSLKRYLHFYNHFTAQEQSMKGDNLFCADIENKLMRIQENLKNDVSWIELQFYKDSVNTLLRCRRTLKWSYALVYYLKNSNFTTILTDNQLHLSNSVEKLSKLFEIFQPEQIMSKKRDFNSVSDYLLRREKLLVECTIEGIMKGELQFNVDENGTYLE